MTRMNSFSEAEWTVIESLYRKAFKEAKKKARASFEQLGQPAGHAMVRGPGFGVAVRLEHLYGETQIEQEDQALRGLPGPSRD